MAIILIQGGESHANTVGEKIAADPKWWQNTKGKESVSLGAHCSEFHQDDYATKGV